MVFISITPVPKPRLTQRDRWAHRPIADRYFAFCDELRLKYPHPLPDRLFLEFAISMPRSWSKAKKASLLNRAHQQKPDIDNLCKAVMDALSKDDSNVYFLSATKYWTDKPGIEIRNLQL